MENLPSLQEAEKRGAHRSSHPSLAVWAQACAQWVGRKFASRKDRTKRVPLTAACRLCRYPQLSAVFSRRAVPTSRKNAVWTCVNVHSSTLSPRGPVTNTGLFFWPSHLLSALGACPPEVHPAQMVLRTRQRPGCFPRHRRCPCWAPPLNCP